MVHNYIFLSIKIPRSLASQTRLFPFPLGLLKACLAASFTGLKNRRPLSPLPPKLLPPVP